MATRATDLLTDTAQQELATLRGELVSRLSVLEAALADPTRGESLAGLILDLSRIATEEAQAAATEACLSTKAEADKQMAELRASAKTALDAAQSGLRAANESLAQERAAVADLRREVEQTQLELQKQNELLEAREDYETELQNARMEIEEELTRAREQMGYEVDRQQAIATELAREHETALAEVQARLEDERATSAELRWALERNESKLTAAERQQADVRSAHDGDREALDQALADLAAERAANAELREAVAHAGEHRAELDARQRTELDTARKRIEALTVERDAVAAELLAAQKWLIELREAEAEFASAAATAHTTPNAPSSGTAPVKASEQPQEGWQPIQLASRYAFSESLLVEINGARATLVDVSISGCQLVSESPLKPHQTVKVQLSSDPLLACGGKVVWTRLEAGAGGALSYRAGVRFTKPDESAIEAFAARHAGT